jgi:hypothetical protein
MIEPEFNRFLRSIIETLEQLGLTYGIGGSVASSLYGEARSTLDVDISVVLPLDRVLDFTQAFQALVSFAVQDWTSCVHASVFFASSSGTEASVRVIRRGFRGCVRVCANG